MAPLEDEEKRVLLAWAESLGLRFMDMDESTHHLGGREQKWAIDTLATVEAIGRENLMDVIRPASPDEIVTICYTSVRYPRAFCIDSQLTRQIGYFWNTER